MGCRRADLLGRFTLLQVEEKLKAMEVHCPKKGGKQFVHTGAKVGWYVEIYRPTAREEIVVEELLHSGGDGVVLPTGTER